MDNIAIFSVNTECVQQKDTEFQVRCSARSDETPSSPCSGADSRRHAGVDGAVRHLRLVLAE